MIDDAHGISYSIDKKGISLDQRVNRNGFHVEMDSI
jgi:hypothetical protein